MKIVYLRAGPGIDIRPDVDGERVRRRLNLAGRFVEAERHSWSENARIVAELAGARQRPSCSVVPGRVQMSTARPARG